MEGAADLQGVVADPLVVGAHRHDVSVLAAEVPEIVPGGHRPRVGEMTAQEQTRVQLRGCLQKALEMKPKVWDQVDLLTVGAGPFSLSL